ncbi:MAG: FAD-dependent 5-carboxymethylaminomethyl-2-thiouridine(34) oxidoreductase MnmC [Alphaproteobacteria bacterium]|nr:FAD-dependent 5-carboxymethylaminomethyl-2-thiouridine(34) oxidoreductase MnmC [Alphaproteobacteria bacterium]
MKKIAIIGGGLAGTACAHALKKIVDNVVIYEAGPTLASGASGNKVGLYNPRLAAEVTPESEYYMRAFKRAPGIFEQLRDIDWNSCGALHLITDEKRDIRYRKMIESWGWPDEDMRLVSAQEASEIAGVALSHDSLYLPRSGYVSPEKLCHALADGAEVRLNMRIENLDELEADVVILACGMNVQNFEGLERLNLRGVRGQVTYAAPGAVSRGLKTALCYGGYLSPAHNGEHAFGASFQRWLSHTDIIPQDDLDNLEKLAVVAPVLAEDMRITNHRAAMRTTASDHFPIVGRVRDGVYVSTAHGSHGIINSLEAAAFLRDLITGQSPDLPRETIERLSPARYTHAT